MKERLLCITDLISQLRHGRFAPPRLRKSPWKPLLVLGWSNLILQKNASLYFVGYLMCIYIWTSLLSSISLWGSVNICWDHFQITWWRENILFNVLKSENFLVSSDFCMRPVEWNSRAGAQKKQHFPFPVFSQCLFQTYLLLRSTDFFFFFVYVPVHKASWEPVLLCFAQGYLGNKQNNSVLEQKVRPSLGCITGAKCCSF